MFGLLVLMDHYPITSPCGTVESNDSQPVLIASHTTSIPRHASAATVYHSRYPVSILSIGTHISIDRLSSSD